MRMGWVQHTIPNHILGHLGRDMDNSPHNWPSSPYRGKGGNHLRGWHPMSPKLGLIFDDKIKCHSNDGLSSCC